jgi:hypothetical protein
MTADVRITNYLGVQVAATFPDITRTAVTLSNVDFRETFKGLGDTSVVGWYRPEPVWRWNVVLNIGVSVPTGKTEEPEFRSELDAGNLVSTHRLQRGSGTFDPLFGASIVRPFRSLTVFGSVAARVPLSENGDGLRTGASSELNGGVGRELGTHRVNGFARVEWLHRAQDAFRGTSVLEGGGDWIYLTPGVAIQVGRGINVQGELKLPTYRALANRQLDSKTILQFGVSRAF